MKVLLKRSFKRLEQFKIVFVIPPHLHTHEDIACSFAKLILESKVSTALKLLSKDFDYAC